MSKYGSGVNDHKELGHRHESRKLELNLMMICLKLSQQLSFKQESC